MTIDRIKEIVHKFGEAAGRAVEAGFKMIEIHGAHGYLVSQFLSKYSNIREDQYGGDTFGRTRFAREIVEEIKGRVGKDFPLSFKISAQEFVPGGLTVLESVEILKQLAEAGVDIVQVSAGTDTTPEWVSQPMFMKRACLADSAERIRKALKIPVMAVGRINDPLVADAIISEGKADLVCIGRGLLADPEMPKKAKEGRLDDIRICIACNTCMESIFRKGRIECLVNPSLGREEEMKIRPADTSKKVMVVGGGPGGLNVAWVAAKRGHDVHLYEKESILGGQLNLGGISSYKKELLNLIEFQRRQIKKFGVRCHINFQVTYDTVKKENPDVVILATGSKPITPPVKGIDKSIILTLPDILTDDKPERRKIVIIGGGSTGCEVALHLSDNGCPVTIVEQFPKIGGQMESVTKKVFLSILKKNGVRIMTGYKLSRVEDTGVFVMDKDGSELFIEADNVVIAVGSKPDNSLYNQIKSMGITIHQIGDCIEPRGAKAAIYEGAVIGRAI